MPTFDNRFAPAFDYDTIDPNDLKSGPGEAGGMAQARRNLAAGMPAGQPPGNAAKEDWHHLVTGQPEPTQVAGEGAGVSTAKTASIDDWHHLVTGKPESEQQDAKEPATVAESVQQSKAQGRGVPATFQNAIQTLIKQHPRAASIYGTAAAANTGIPLAGAAAMGVNALPLWAQVLGGYLGYHAGSAAGIPEAAGNLWHLLRQSVPH